MSAPSASAVMRYAAGQIGVQESPTGSNRTVFGSRYGWNGVPWCNIFVSEAGRAVSGGYDLLGKFAGTIACADWWVDRRRWLGPQERPRLGDVVFFNWDSATDKRRGAIDHIGLVERDLGHGWVQTVEGNVTVTVGGVENGRVWRAKRFAPDCVVGYGRPAYAAPRTPHLTSRPRTRYVVKRGDTLSQIAAAHRTTVATLVADNSIADPDRIVVGQTLTIRVGRTPKALPRVRLSHLQAAARHDLAGPVGTKSQYAAEVLLAEQALFQLGFLEKAYVDGSAHRRSFGPDSAWQRLQLHLWPRGSTRPGGTCDGVVGPQSLAWAARSSGLFVAVED